MKQQFILASFQGVNPFNACDNGLQAMVYHEHASGNGLIFHKRLMDEASGCEVMGKT